MRFTIYDFGFTIYDTCAVSRNRRNRLQLLVCGIFRFFIQRRVGGDAGNANENEAMRQKRESANSFTSFFLLPHPSYRFSKPGAVAGLRPSHLSGRGQETGPSVILTGSLNLYHPSFSRGAV